MNKNTQDQGNSLLSRQLILIDMFLGKLYNLGGQSFLQGPGAARMLAHTHLATVLSATRGWQRIFRLRMQRLRME